MKLKFSGHLDMLLGDMSPTDKIVQFSELGYPAVELWCWWEEKYDIDALADSLELHNIEMAAICTKFVSLTEPAQREQYLAGLVETIDACKRLSCRTIISQVGIDGLKAAAQILDGTGISLVIEPLNLLVDHAGYFLARSDEAAEIVEAVGASSVKMLFDIYHQQITEGNLINNIRKYSSLIGHFHIADNPGRQQPGTGEINYSNVLKAIENLGYNGFLGLEFFPKGNSRIVIENFRNTFMS